MLNSSRATIALISTLVAGLALASSANARPVSQDGPCRVSRAALDTLVLEESLETVVRKLGCPGSVRSVEVVAGELRFQIRIWQVDVWPYGQFTGEFINGELHGMTKAWLDFSVTY